MLYYFLSLTDVVNYITLALLAAGLVGRWFVFKKMGVRPWLSIIPLVHEYVIFKKCWKAWPFVVLSVITVLLVVLSIVSNYVNIFFMSGIIEQISLIIAALLILFITILMYKCMAFAFGHDIGYLAGLLFLNPVFLLLLGFSKKNQYQEERAKLRGRERRRFLNEHRSKRTRIFARLSTAALVIVLALGGLGYGGYMMISTYQPEFMVNVFMKEFAGLVDGKVDGKGKVIYPAKEAKAAGYAGSTGEMRDLFYPDKSQVKDVTVHRYVIGADLEHGAGFATYNLKQIIDATKGNDNIKFIIEAGGSGRWIQEEIKDKSVGRYMIKNGEVSLIEEMDSKTCMSEPKVLEEFLTWANKEYPSERPMLIFWDHGGGLAGYGYDTLNKRDDGKKILSVPEMAGALKKSGAKYDVIDFDACLMQTIEVAHALEPYTDYLLASEETEPGSGQYYTEAFKALAKNPTMSTVEFGAMECSSYDQYLKLRNDGKAQKDATLSLVETRKVPAAYDSVIAWMAGEDREFKTNRSSFINMSKARARSYTFAAEDHIDLIDFISLNSMPKAEKQNLINQVKSAVAVRNAASAKHINGMSVYMPYTDLGSYGSANEVLNKLKLNKETKVYNDFASIVASQKTTKADAGSEPREDYSDEKWFVKDFANYNASLTKQDIPLKKKGDNYTIGLSDKEWKLVTDVELGVKMKVGSKYADLGSDPKFAKAKDGRYTLQYDGTWATINGVPVAMQPVNTQQTDKGNIYISKVPATINMFEEVNIYIQRDEREGMNGEAKILGFAPVAETEAKEGESEKNVLPKGYNEFKSGTFVTFTYDWYDEEGNFVRTAMGHLPVKVDDDGLTLEQSDITGEDFRYYGIIYDTGNNRMETEVLENE